MEAAKIAPIVALPSTSRYELLVKIASGGMATVYVGRLSGAVGFSRLVAVKRAHSHLLEDPMFGRMLIAEARLASKIHHPNVVSVQDVEELDGELLLIMDYVEGTALSQLIAQVSTAGEKVPVGIALRIVIDACAGLHAAHQVKDDDGKPLGLVHRDVSPHNVLVGTDGAARIADFGIAKVQGGTGANTTTGALKGKVAYMAPEYVSTGQADVRSDVFALGVVAWEALTQKRLFRGQNEVETLRLVLAADAPPIHRIAPWVPPSISDVVMTALAPEPDRRFQNASAFGAALEVASRAASATVTAGEVGAFVDTLFGSQLATRRDAIKAKLAASSGETAKAKSAVTSAQPFDGFRTATMTVVNSEHTQRMSSPSQPDSSERAPQRTSIQPGADVSGVLASPRNEAVPHIGAEYAASLESQGSLAEGTTTGAAARSVKQAREGLELRRSRAWIAVLSVIAAAGVVVAIGLGVAPRFRDAVPAPEVKASASSDPIAPPPAASSSVPSAPAESAALVTAPTVANKPVIDPAPTPPPSATPARPRIDATPAPKPRTSAPQSPRGDKAPPNPYAH